jgi:acetyl-CoA C-acetyltransferase
MTACFGTLDDAFWQDPSHTGSNTQAQLTRASQDRFAERSQRRFSAAQKAGKFANEIVAIDIRGKKGIEAFAADEAPRPDTTFEGLTKLRPAFREGGTITAGNAPGLNSGAAAMIVADRAFAEARSVEPMARLVAYGVAAVEPGMFGLGPVPAVRKALERAGGSSGMWSASRSTKPLPRCRWLSRKSSASPEDIINVEGGAIAHGHPIGGATGAVLTTRLIHSMRRDGLKRGSSRRASGVARVSRWPSRRSPSQL